MNDPASHLVERVIPEVPVRQWVCTLPFRLRYLCGYDRTWSFVPIVICYCQRPLQ